MTDQCRISFSYGLMMFCFVHAMLVGTRQKHSVKAFSCTRVMMQHRQVRRRSHYVENHHDDFSNSCTTSSIIQLNADSTKKTSKSNNKIGMQKRLAQRPPVFLSHERDFFRQETRLASMDSYVLVSTLTASMSFGCLVGFKPQTADAASATAILKLATSTQISGTLLQSMYRLVCLSIQVASGMSALCGLYATVIFSLTILYGKSALGAERDREYDKFLRRTVRSRVHGARCFSLSLALFALTTVLLLIERTFLCGSALPVGAVAFSILYRLYKDWKELSRGRDQIFRDQP